MWLSRLAPGLLACAALLALPGAASAESAGPDYSATQVVVKYLSPAPAAPRASSASAADPSAQPPALVRVRTGETVAQALRRLRHRRDVAWAVPDYRAHVDNELIPNDRGTAGVAGGWQQLQWNFVGPESINAPEAWANVAADGAPGGSGVVVAVLDTGVAYANRGSFRRSPDFSRFQFVGGYDFIARNHYPNDRNGHGTFVASTIAEQANNGYGLTGLAYGAKIMPIRVLDSEGEGEASTIAEGVRFAVNHGARVINLSLEFSSNVTASDIPELLDALHYANRRGVFVDGAAGNEARSAIAYPARAPDVVAVGATTEHGCLADYSNDGLGLTLVAPGGEPTRTSPAIPTAIPNSLPGATYSR